MLDITALGELLIDFTCLDIENKGYPVMAAHPGGAPANFLAAVAALGGKTALLAKVGSDAFGRQLCKTLDRAGIETRGIVFADDTFTTLAFVTLDEGGNRSFSFARKPGADTQLRFGELDLSLIADAKAFHFGSLSLTHEPARSATCKAVEYAKGLGKLITFDPNLRLPLWNSPEDARGQMLWGLNQADVVKISDDEVDFLFGLKPQEGAEYILSHYPVKLVFVTCGAQGCWYKNPVACGCAGIPQGIQPVDTTGAGDIFGGTAVWSLLRTGKSPERLTAQELDGISRFACAAASLSTTVAGGISSVPAYEDICKLCGFHLQGEI